MSVHVNVRVSKIMRTSIKASLRTYGTYANCHIQKLKIIDDVIRLEFGECLL